MPDHDPDLRARFAALATEDAGLAPPFDRTVARRLMAPPPGRRWALAAAALLVTTAAGGYAWMAARRRPPPYPVDLAVVTWSGPTDFLLETPGTFLLRDLPEFGDASDDAPADPGLTDDTLRRNRT